MSDRSKSRSRSRSRSRSKGGDKSDDGSGEEEIYEVEEIRDKRRGDDGDWLYYVKWVSMSTVVLREICVLLTAVHRIPI